MRFRLLFFCLCTLVPLFLEAQCSADFSFQQDPCSPKTVSFSASLSSVQSFLWNFGNSTSNNSTLNPNILYSSYGNYNVSLTVTYTNGCTVTQTHMVSVTDMRDNNLISTPNSTICAGDNILLHATGTAANFCWHTASATLNTSSHDVTVSPSTPTVYYYTAQAQGGEAVTNGDFSNGNTGFTTDYTNCNTFECIGEGNYAVGPDAQFFHFDFRGFDHTTGTGNFLMANGMLTANANVWCQSVPVTPNTNYDFSMWICTVAGEYAPAQLQLLVNGVAAGTVATAPSTIYTWIQHTATWNSGSATTADLCIVTVSDWFGGNDFGIDDISFGSPSTSLLTDSIFVDVQLPPTANISYASPFCSSLNSPQAVILTGSGGFTGGMYTATTGLSIDPVSGAILPAASQPGTYTVTYTTPAPGSCPAATSTATVIINPVSTSNSNVTICNNQLPYSWNGNTYLTAGVYSVSLTSSTGCDSIATLDLTVNNTLSSTTNIIICNNQLPYSWNGNTYGTAGTYPVTLTSSIGCDSIATLNLNVNNTLTSSTSITICNNQLPYSWNGNTYSTAGTYSVSLTSSTGCDSLATLNLDVNNTLTSSTSITICNNQLPYSWNGNTYSTAGTHPVTLTSSTGCDSIATLNLNVNNTLTSSTNITICNNQLPYSWNGNPYATAGTYSVSLTSSTGCDSLATLNLIVNNTLSSTTIVSICNNQLPYSWNGNTYLTAGVYSVSLTSSTGCDSIATLNLTVNNTLSSTTIVTICNNQLPYSWNGNTYGTAGTYPVSLTSSTGCDSIATLNLTVNNTLSSTTNIAICNNQLPYLWNVNTYSTAGTYSVSLTSSTGCDSLATLNLTVNNTLSSATNVSICNNQFPYSWNGNTYATAGTYSVSLTSSTGCDSLATLNLTVNNTLSSTTIVTICNNQLPYLWNGNTYITAGTYPVTLTSSTGCDSIATLNLTVNNTLSSTTNIAICNNQLPYLWNVNTYSTAGTYSVSLTSSTGCDSLATLNLTVNNTLSSATNVSICNNQFPYLWNGNTYATAGTYSVSLSSSTGCDSLATLNLNVNNTLSSTTNITICNNQLPYSWNGNTYSTAGTYSASLTSSTGCDSLATLNLNVNNTLTSSTNITICNNQLPYSWNGNTYSTAGTYSVSLSSSTGCDSIATLLLAVNAITVSTTDISLCPAQLPYLWNGISYTSAGTYIHTLPNSAGCDSVATLNLSLNIAPGAPIITTPVNYCQFEITFPLSAGITSAGNQLLWYDNLSGGTPSTQAPLPSSSVPGATIYYVSQFDGICEGIPAGITVTINSKPDYRDKEIKICPDQAINLNKVYDTTGIMANWTFNEQLLPDVSYIKVPGLYQFIVSDPAGCRDTAFLELVINSPITANAGADTIVEYGMPFHLSGSGGQQYQWWPEIYLDNPFLSNPTGALPHDESFVLMVKDDIGCFGLDTVHIKVLKGPAYYVPTAFSPNGDGLNDIFRPTTPGIANIQYFRVFNRWGEMVFETHIPNRGWDGIFKGKEQPIGNYVWDIKGTDRKGIVKTMKGNVVLIR